jgi:hypothetical protein
MKKAILFLILLIPAFSFSQQADTNQTVTTEQLKQAMIHMRTNLDKSDKQFKRGVQILIAGIAISTWSTFVASNDNSWRQRSTPYWMGLGAAAIIAGTVVMIDSHKFIGRAGRWEFSPGTIKYNL